MIRSKSTKGFAAHIVGIDEVGRGPLAGPVTVAAVLVPAKFPFETPFTASTLRDSKKLSARQREAWFAFLTKSPACSFAVSSVSPGEIDRTNITKAANRAATRAFRTVVRRAAKKMGHFSVFLDAGLTLDQKTMKKLGISVIPRSIVRGDEKIQAIAFASIIAKVTRDRFMRRLHKHHPSYKFTLNKGYGTAAHIRALRLHGHVHAHRLTFIKKYVSIRS